MFRYKEFLFLIWESKLVEFKVFSSEQDGNGHRQNQMYFSEYDANEFNSGSSFMVSATNVPE